VIGGDTHVYGSGYGHDHGDDDGQQGITVTLGHAVRVSSGEGSPRLRSDDHMMRYGVGRKTTGPYRGLERP
jgi:hypothetical protein